jgi:hypothetical protein
VIIEMRTYSLPVAEQPVGCANRLVCNSEIVHKTEIWEISAWSESSDSGTSGRQTRSYSSNSLCSDLLISSFVSSHSCRHCDRK